MTLCDAGPLVALIDQSDAHHERCAATLEALPYSGLLTTWPCLTEAMYLLHRNLGWPGQSELWGLVVEGAVELYQPADDEWARIRELMRRYVDAPMDLADASLVSAAEQLDQRRVFTIDRHFHAYRQQEGHAFEVVP